MATRWPVCFLFSSVFIFYFHIPSVVCVCVRAGPEDKNSQQGRKEGRKGKKMEAKYECSGQGKPGLKFWPPGCCVSLDHSLTLSDSLPPPDPSCLPCKLHFLFVPWNVHSLLT